MDEIMRTRAENKSRFIDLREQHKDIKDEILDRQSLMYRIENEMQLIVIELQRQDARMMAGRKRK